MSRRARTPRHRAEPIRSREGDDSERTEQPSAERLSFNYPHTTWRDLWQALLPKLFAWNVQPSVRVLDEKGQPIAGVEWLGASTPKGIVVNLCNYRDEPLRVTLWRNGKNVGGVDLLSGEKIKGSATLTPLQVRLVLTFIPRHHPLLVEMRVFDALAHRASLRVGFDVFAVEGVRVTDVQRAVLRLNEGRITRVRGVG